MSSNSTSATQHMSTADVEAVRIQNQKLGNFPIVTLADGSQVPTGTIGTLLYNVEAYDTLKAKTSPSEEDRTEMEKLKREMKATIPILLQVGMWKLFNPEEWIAEGRSDVSEGRRYVGRCAIEMNITGK